MASMTQQTWLNKASTALLSQGYDSNEAELLLAFVLQQTKAGLLAHLADLLSAKASTQADLLLQQRLDNQPIAYILGQRDFYGRSFKVNHHVLIPRPDSEVIIDEAKKLLAYRPTGSILDIGTGSGCLIITVALETNNRYTYEACDISAKALTVAKVNAKQLGAQVTWYQSNLLQSVPNKKYDLIIANLPYLTSEQVDEPSIQHEPQLALDGGKDGLHYYRQLLTQLPNYLAVGGTVLLEIDPAQELFLADLIKNNFSPYQLQFYQDLSGLTRLVVLQK